MLMTRESDYAVRIMRALAPGQMMTVKQICEQECIPTQFAYKILKKLANADMIRIIRGASGGYELKRDLHEMTLLDLMDAVGEEGVVNACMRPGYVCSWRGDQSRECLVHNELCRVQEALCTELRRHTIDEILKGQIGENQPAEAL